MNKTKNATTTTAMAALIAMALVLSLVPAGATEHDSDPVDPVNLKSASPFAILAGAGITNTGSTTVIGDVGSHPTASQTGFGPGANSVTITGTNHHDNEVTQQAKVDLETAYNDAADRAGGTPIEGGELGGKTLEPGVYTDDGAPASLSIIGTLTLDGLGNPDSVFIFQSSETLVTATDSDVVLTNGAQACNIYWQVGSSATLDTRSHLEGTILADTSITLNNEATVNGRILAQSGAVTMNSNTIDNVPCQDLDNGNGNGDDNGDGNGDAPGNGDDNGDGNGDAPGNGDDNGDGNGDAPGNGDGPVTAMDPVTAIFLNQTLGSNAASSRWAPSPIRTPASL